MDRVEGTLTAQNSDSYTIAVTQVYQLGGNSSKWNGEPVTITKDGTDGYRVHRFNQTRTVVLAAALAAAVVVFLVSAGLKGSGSDTSLGSGQTGQNAISPSPSIVMIPHHHFSSESGATQMRFQRLIFAVILACGVLWHAPSDVTGKLRNHAAVACLRSGTSTRCPTRSTWTSVPSIRSPTPRHSSILCSASWRRQLSGVSGRLAPRPRLPRSGSRRTPSAPVDPGRGLDDHGRHHCRLRGGHLCTILVHVGSARAGAAVKEKLWIITDALPTQSSATVAYRITGSLRRHAVDVYVRADGTTALSGTPTASSLAFQSASTYLDAVARPARHPSHGAWHTHRGRCGGGLQSLQPAPPARRPLTRSSDPRRAGRS